MALLALVIITSGDSFLFYCQLDWSEKNEIWVKLHIFYSRKYT